MGRSRAKEKRMRRMTTRRLTVLVGAALLAVLAFSGAAWAATTLAVTKTVPAGGATEVSRTANVKAYFNHDMRASTITSSTFKIRKQGTTNWLGATRSVNNTISPTSTNGSSQSVATLNPDADLAANTTYQVLIVGGSSGVKDLNGKALSANKSWTFTTVTPPETTIDPNTGPEGTVASTSASFAFSSSEPNSAFKCSLDGSAFAACDSPKAYPGPLSQGNHTFKVRAIDPTGTQDPSPASRSWTVDTAAPMVGSVSPADGATGVSPTSNVTAIFSEAMNANTVTGQSFTLSKDGSSVSAQVTYDQNSRTATLDPAGDLQAGATYDAKITTIVKDSAGNALAQEKAWSFAVKPATDGVTITPNPLVLSPTDVLFCSPRQEYLTVTNSGPDNVTFASVTIAGPDAAYFSSGSQSYLANNGPFTVLAGNYFRDQVTFRPGSTPEDRNRNYSATLTYKDGAGATLGTPVSLTASVGCLNF
jgi:hypothetical protein